MKLVRSILNKAIAAAVITATATLSLAAAAYDFTKPDTSLSAFLRMRGDLSGRDVITDWHTTVFIVEPGKRAVPIMRLDGFNVGRVINKNDGSYQWLSREVAYYRDLKTGKILDKWDNPVTGKTNDVVQVINDPVNSLFAPGRVMPWRVKGDDVMMTFDVPLAYPNALLPADFPEESTGPTYFATESFMFFAKQGDFDNAKLESVPVTYAWARTGPWLPWMKMGTRPGFVLYTGQGKKLKTAAELDPVVREYTEKNHPDFMTAPKSLVTPNETSWSYYRKLSGKKITSPAGGHAAETKPTEATKK